MSEKIDVDRAITYINQTFRDNEGKTLNDTQELVIRGTLQGQSYGQMAQLSESQNGSTDHLKNIGYGLWQKLTQYWGDEVGKKRLKGILSERLQEVPQRVRTNRILPAGVMEQRYQWGYAFNPIWKNASACRDWIPGSGYYLPSDLDECRAKIAAYFATQKHYEAYDELRQQWNEVRGFAHVYDWSELRQETLSWLLEQAKGRGQSECENIWHDHIELAWAKSISGNPSLVKGAIEELQNLWKQTSSLNVSHLEQLELAIDLCATALNLNRIDESAQWLKTATELFDRTSVRKNDHRWNRCEIDIYHYQAVSLAAAEGWKSSVKSYKKAIKLARGRRYHRAVARSQLGLARVEIVRSRPEKARPHLNRGFESVSQHCDLRGRGFFAREQASLNNAMGNHERAEERLAIARDAFRELGMAVKL